MIWQKRYLSQKQHSNNLDLNNYNTLGEYKKKDKQGQTRTNKDKQLLFFSHYSISHFSDATGKEPRRGIKDEQEITE